MPADKLLAGIERLISPKLNEMLGELKAINTRIDSTNERIDSTNERIDSLRNETKADIEGLRKEMLSKFEAEDVKIDSLRNEMSVKFDSLEKRIPVIEKMAVLELRIAELEKRLATA